MTALSSLVRAFAISFFFAFTPALAQAQVPAAGAAGAERSTPHGAWTRFLDAADAGDFDDAAEFLDASHLPARIRDARAEGLARVLHLTCIRSGLGRGLALSQLPEGTADDDLAADEDALGVIPTPLGDALLVLARLDLPGDTSEWRLASRSVAQLPFLQRVVQRSPLEPYLPSWALSAGFMDIASWQWVALPLLLFLAWLVARPVGPAVRRVATRMLRDQTVIGSHPDEAAPGTAGDADPKSEDAESSAVSQPEPEVTDPALADAGAAEAATGDRDDPQPSPSGEAETEDADQVLQLAVASITSPACWLVAFAAWALSCQFLGLPDDFSWLLVRVQISLLIAASAWFLASVLGASTHLRQRQLEATGRAGAASVVGLLRRAGSIAVWTLAVVAVMQNVGLKVTGVLGALGVGGIAIALAAQKTIENLFGGVALLLDQPVRVGDFCRFGTATGTIEEVGLRSVRIRTLDRTVLTIPNGQFSELQIENYGRRDRIRMLLNIGLRYETTPAQMRQVLEELRRVLNTHPRVWDESWRARFVNYGDSSLDLEVSAYVTATEWKEFLEVKEDILLRFMETIEACGTSVAFPSRTIYLTSDEGPGGRQGDVPLPLDDAQASEQGESPGAS